jgi:hypothetical protein
VSGQEHAPAVLYPRERPGTHCTGGWVGPRAGMDGEKSRRTGIRAPDRPARSQSLYRLSYPAKIEVSLVETVAKVLFMLRLNVLIQHV